VQVAANAARRGKPLTEAHTAAYETLKSRPLTERQLAAHAARRGKPPTETQAAALAAAGAARRGMPISPEVIARLQTPEVRAKRGRAISAVKKGKPWSAIRRLAYETRFNVTPRAARTPVPCSEAETSPHARTRRVL
jgi:hypothetical protein